MAPCFKQNRNKRYLKMIDTPYFLSTSTFRLILMDGRQSLVNISQI